MKERVKCIAVRAHSGAPRDPVLVKGKFYTVLDENVYTMADETPYIRVLADGKAIERPRHLFGPVMLPAGTKMSFQKIGGRWSAKIKCPSEKVSIIPSPFL